MITQAKATNRKSKILNLFFAWALVAGLLGAQAPTAAQAAAATPPARAAAPLMQFTAGGHIVGFQPGGLYLAALDHALHIEFVDAASVRPQAAGGGASVAQPGPGQPPPLDEVAYPDLWPGISVEYRAAEGSILKSCYHLAPGADAAQIRLRYNVAGQLQDDGSLQLPYGRGYLSEAAPLAWQEIDGRRTPVAVRFTLTPAGLVGFELGAYDPRYGLTIDPAYTWHTFYGAPDSHSDEARSVALDGSGNIYIAGQGDGDWVGDNGAAALHAYGEGYNIFMVKLNSSGAYQWHTFYGSTDGYNFAYGVAVDGSGNVYVVGNSGASWQGDGGANPLHAHSGYVDIVVLKLNSSGAYQWHTFYGSLPVYDYAYGVALDGSSNLYIAGESSVSWQGDGGANPLNAHTDSGDIMVLKLNSSGGYQWHTFYGAAVFGDGGYSVAVDASGNSYVVGYSGGAWDGPGSIAPIHAFSGETDFVALKLNSSGAYQWHTFYGSVTGSDFAYSVALDGSGSLYIAGQSSASWQGDGLTDPLHPFNGSFNYDIAVLKLNTSGAYQWHTFYGSSGTDYVQGVAAAGSGGVYVVGHSYATWQGDGPTEPRHAFSGNCDLTILKLNSSGAYQWHTFYGASGYERSYGATLDGGGNLYVAGSSQSSWSGDGDTGSLHLYSGGYDLVMLKLSGAGNYQWHTFYGAATGDDYAYAVAVDSNNNIYLAGMSSDTWLGAGGAPARHAFSGGLYDLVVVKLNSSGDYQWHTFYGSDQIDYAYGVAVDWANNIYVVGWSNAGWQGPGAAAPLHAYAGAEDLTILKLNPNGAYQWHTFYGSAGYERALGVAVAGGVSLYVAGSGETAWQGEGGANPIHAYSGANDILIMKLSTSGAYQWHTFYGSASASETATGIAADGSGSVYISASSSTTWLGDSDAAPLHASSGATEIAALKLNSGGGYQWHTFYGSTTNDTANAVALDGGGNVYLTGSSYATWQGDGGVNPRHPYAGGWDLMALKLNSSGAYQWHTFYGSTANDYGYAAAVDGNGNAYVVGVSSATWQGDGNTDPMHPHSGSTDLVVVRLDSSGNYQRHTFYGSTNADYANGAAVGGGGNLYLAGSSQASWQGDALADPLHAHAGHNEIMALKLHLSVLCTAVNDGFWSDPAVWDCTQAPGEGNSVLIGSARTVTLDLDRTGLVNITLGGTLQHDGSAHTLALIGNWLQSGTFTPGTLIGVGFNGLGYQTIIGSPTFYNLGIGSGVILQTSSPVTVNGTILHQAGSITRETRTISGTGAENFYLAGDLGTYPVVIGIGAQGDLSQIVVQRIENDHPGRTGAAGSSGVGWGYYLTLTPTGCASNNCTYQLVLPHPGWTDPAVCRFVSGITWDCARTGYNANLVWRGALHAFSQWAPGNHVGPTALEVREFKASSQSGWPVVLGGLLVLGMLGWLLGLAKRRAG